MIDCRLIIDDPAEGAWNMAVDEALMASARDAGVATLRLYRWEPTLSLGYFQAYADRAGHEPSAALPCVRRSSGGGALVHHHEVTYSLALPVEAVAGRDTRSLYCEAHCAVIDVVRGLGGEADRMSLCDPDAPKRAPSEEPFLCFERRADGDLLVEAPHSGVMDSAGPARRYKVTGSAQRKRQGALLQHGGVLLARSPHAPELPGLAELGLPSEEPQHFATQLAAALGERLGLRLAAAALSTTERQVAQDLRANKHAAGEWRERR